MGSLVSGSEEVSLSHTDNGGRILRWARIHTTEQYGVKFASVIIYRDSVSNPIGTYLVSDSCKYYELVMTKPETSTYYFILTGGGRILEIEEEPKRFTDKIAELRRTPHVNELRFEAAGWTKMRPNVSIEIEKVCDVTVDVNDEGEIMITEIHSVK